MVVLKFGGTSVGSAERMDSVLDICTEFLPESPVLISSAMSGITNRLVAIGDHLEDGDSSKAMEEWEAIRLLHVETAESFLEGDILQEALEDIESHLKRLLGLIKGLGLLQEASPRSRDTLVSFGEILSTRLLYHRARMRSMDVSWKDSRDLVKTDDNFQAAKVDMEQTFSNIKTSMPEKTNHLYIAQGFIGSTERPEHPQVTTTLGRGGSDYSSTIYGAALHAREVQIWTDVNGIMTSDPRKVDGVQTIEKITYDEAAELAFFGAKVVHPSTIQPAVHKSIPVLVKNTMDPHGPYTTIGPDAPGEGLRAISGKKNITLVTITSSRMLEAYGFLKKIFEVFENHTTPVDLLATSEVSVSMTIEDTSKLPSIIQDLQVYGEVGVEKDSAIVCLVGPRLWKNPGLISRVFHSISGVEIRMISMGASDINLSFVVPEEDVDETIRKVHGEFYPAG
jgi:aspartate kinase